MYYQFNLLCLSLVLKQQRTSHHHHLQGHHIKRRSVWMVSYCNEIRESTISYKEEVGLDGLLLQQGNQYKDHSIS